MLLSEERQGHSGLPQAARIPVALKQSLSAPPDPIVDLRVTCSELNLDFSMPIPVHVPESRSVNGLVQTLAAAMTCQRACDLGKAAGSERWNLLLQERIEKRNERHSFYSQVQQQFEGMAKTIQELKTDYWKEIDHLRETISRLRQDSNHQVDQVFYFKPDSYKIPPWEEIVEMLDGRRMRREVIREQGGPMIKKVPVHMLCSVCQKKFKDGHARVPDPVNMAVQTDAVTSLSSFVQTEEFAENFGFDEEVMRNVVERGDHQDLKILIFSFWRQIVNHSQWKKLAAASMIFSKLGNSQVSSSAAAAAAFNEAELLAGNVRDASGTRVSTSASAMSEIDADRKTAASRFAERVFGSPDQSENSDRAAAERQSYAYDAGSQAYSDIEAKRKSQVGVASELEDSEGLEIDDTKGSIIIGEGGVQEARLKLNAFEAFRQNVCREKKRKGKLLSVEDVLKGKARQMEAYARHIRRLAIGRGGLGVGRKLSGPSGMPLGGKEDDTEAVADHAPMIQSQTVAECQKSSPRPEEIKPVSATIGLSPGMKERKPSLLQRPRATAFVDQQSSPNVLLGRVDDSNAGKSRFHVPVSPVSESPFPWRSVSPGSKDKQSHQEKLRPSSAGRTSRQALMFPSSSPLGRVRSASALHASAARYRQINVINMDNGQCDISIGGFGMGPRSPSLPSGLEVGKRTSRQHSPAANSPGGLALPQVQKSLQRLHSPAASPKGLAFLLPKSLQVEP
eukprot:TRINITY_DN4403_c1_g1_i2.p1 TRINITY_DN4403_c1_g1~~TRINITY_DN4403_c1_g1_i2.p1  ORF type:complete len:735 (+),score=114.42 TRINITY_DN4403_c1_g1_i2:58-2262(+)